jgi:hypothetical protein
MTPVTRLGADPAGLPPGGCPLRSSAFASETEPGEEGAVGFQRKVDALPEQGGTATAVAAGRGAPAGKRVLTIYAKGRVRSRRLIRGFDLAFLALGGVLPTCRAVGREPPCGLVDAVRTFGSSDTDQLTALRLFTREVTEVSFRHQAALQIRMFDAPTTASSSLKTVIHARCGRLHQRDHLRRPRQLPA